MDSRYSRQTPVWGSNVQNYLNIKRIGIVGLGALGSNVLNQLVRMGANNITIVDRDIVELHNLHRCALYEESNVGLPKAYAAYSHLSKINKNITCEYHIKDISEDMSMLNDCDIVIECLDSIEIRRLLDNYLKNKKIPWIHGAGIKNYGEVKAFNNNQNNSDCYSCFSQKKESNESCSIDGVNPTLTTMIAALQVHEAIKLLAKPKSNYDYLLRLNLDSLELRKIKSTTQCDCKSKNKKSINSVVADRSCGKGVYRFKMDNSDFLRLKKEKKIKNELAEKSFFKHNNIVLTQDKRIIVNAKDEKTAEKEVSKFLNEF
jgi:molybdopterin-synthase adenylyltransferase